MRRRVTRSSLAHRFFGSNLDMLNCVPFATRQVSAHITYTTHVHKFRMFITPFSRDSTTLPSRSSTSILWFFPCNFFFFSRTLPGLVLFATALLELGTHLFDASLSRAKQLRLSVTSGAGA